MGSWPGPSGRPLTASRAELTVNAEKVQPNRLCLRNTLNYWQGLVGNGTIIPIPCAFLHQHFTQIHVRGHLPECREQLFFFFFFCSGTGLKSSAVGQT